MDPPGESEASALPETDPECRPITSARCAASLAWHDAYHRQRRERESADERFSGGRIERSVRVSGVLGSADPDRTARRLWLMRLYGLRDFKLKLGFGDEIDAENLRVVEKRIGKAVKKGKCTLRVDANAAWQREETPARVAALKACGVCVVEQPVLVPAQELIGLAQRCELPLMADESVVTLADADLFLRAAGRKVWLNVRISKNGGPGAACRIAKAAAGAARAVRHRLHGGGEQHSLRRPAACTAILPGSAVRRGQLRQVPPGRRPDEGQHPLRLRRQTQET